MIVPLQIVALFALLVLLMLALIYIPFDRR